MNQSDVLFKKFNSSKLDLKNRIVMAPMTRFFSANGVPTTEVAEYYARRARADVGLIITEGTVINRASASNDPNIPHIYGEESLEGWKQVVNRVHEEGGKIAPQLWHMGIVPYMKNWRPSVPMEGPSGYINPEQKSGIQMTEEDIQKTISAYAEAALNSKNLGFDAVEIHGAHGYLIDQFFWEKMNKRTDHWGGKNIGERNHFAIAVIKAIRKAVGEDFPLIIRLSQWKQQDYSAKIATNPKEMEEWLLPLSEAGIDIFHCSQRRFWEPEFEGSDLNFAGWAKKITHKPSISVGSVALTSDFLGTFKGESSQPNAGSIEQLLNKMQKNEFDLIAVGRALLADPEWVIKVKNNNIQDFKDFKKEYLKTLF